MALGIKPADLGLKPDQLDGGPWGLLMEAGLQNGTAYSLVVFLDGTTSLYFSTGGGFIGAGQHEPVRAASQAMLGVAARSLSHARYVESTPLPSPGRVQFYFLSEQGTLGYSIDEPALAQGQDPLSELFRAGHAVIAQIRLMESTSPDARPS